MKKRILLLLLLLSAYIQPKESFIQSAKATLCNTALQIKSNLQYLYDITLYPLATMIHDIVLVKTSSEMSEKFNAQPCKNKQLCTLFDDIQNELSIRNKIPLYTCTKKPRSCSCTNATAFYVTGIKAVAIIPQKFYALSDMEKRFVLYHELKHHLQFSSYVNAFDQDAQQLLQQGKLTYEQALEHDADLFGLACVTKNCPTCINEFIPRFDKTKPVPYRGYLTQKDALQVYHKALKKGCYCSKHKSGIGRLTSHLKTTLRKF